MTLLQDTEVFFGIPLELVHGEYANLCRSDKLHAYFKKINAILQVLQMPRFEFTNHSQDHSLAIPTIVYTVTQLVILLLSNASEYKTKSAEQGQLFCLEK